MSDATTPNGNISNPIFEKIPYDVLTIGNHELYVSDIAYEHFNQFAAAYGKHYVNSNVKIMNKTSGKYEVVGNQYRYFTTPMGLKIMTYGVLYDFTGNSNASQIQKGAAMINETWFQNTTNPKNFDVDLFLLIGHNPIRANVSSNTLKTVYGAIRKANPNIPIQIFGGHSHIRDFQVYDNKATALESGRYCETLGFLSMSGFPQKGDYDTVNPHGVPNPNRTAVVVSNNATAQGINLTTSAGGFNYSRRYLDWNRLTFAYHANGSQDHTFAGYPSGMTFDTAQGKAVTQNITASRKQLNLTALYGCAPQTWCLSCKPFGDPGNINSILTTALSAVVINQTRKATPRMIFVNTGHARFDLVEGPFTYDDSFIVSPFHDAFLYIPNVPYASAVKVLDLLNAGGASKKRSVDAELKTRDFGFSAFNPSLPDHDSCVNPPLPAAGHLEARALTKNIIRRQSTSAKAPAGYVTVDDFGVGTGDDTVHTNIPYYNQPNYIAANGSLPTDGSKPAVVDVVFLDFIQSYVITALQKAGSTYTPADVSYYLPVEFDTNSYLPAYAKIAPEWQKNVPNCPVGAGVGS